MNAETRVKKVEDAVGTSAGEYCHCPGPVEMHWQDEGQPEPEEPICPNCGKPRQVIVVRWAWEDEPDPAAIEGKAEEWN